MREKKNNITRMQQALTQSEVSALDISATSPPIPAISPAVAITPATPTTSGMSTTSYSCPKYKRIPDYIPKAARTTEEEVDLGNGVKLKLNSTSKVKVEQITPSQYLAASSKILLEMIQESGKTQELVGDVVDYLLYLVKVGELGCRYTWSSVMLFDDVYREQQVVRNYTWGTDNQHMHTLLLKERDIKPSGQKSYPQKKVSDRGKGTCNGFNTIRGCSYDPCTFSHVCSICGGDHRKMDHPAGTSG